jgi:hypothetical protein
MDYNFVLNLAVVIGGWISLYVHTEKRLTTLEQKNEFLKSMVEDHKTTQKDLQNTLNKNTEAIIELKTVLNNLK